MNSEGLFTNIWGPAQWQSLHNITFNYPHNPTEDDKEKYYNYFMALGDVLPCCTCRDNYINHLKEGDTKITYEVFKNRNTLTRWLYNLHKKVCDILGFEYDITYEMMCKKHNSYIAKCALTVEQKTDAYINLYDVHAPVLRLNVLLCFAEYAKERGLNNFVENIKKYSDMDRESKEWYERNQKCQEQIKYMRMNGICSCETEGKYKKKPTINELKLMEMASTTITKREIKKILQNMGCKFIKTYKFSK